MIRAKVFDVISYRFVLVEVDETKPNTATVHRDVPVDWTLPTFDHFDIDGNPVLRRPMLNGVEV